MFTNLDFAFPLAACLKLNALEIADALVTATLSVATIAANCPLCNQSSGKVHSKYIRQLADLPCFGLSFKLLVQVRRFFCLNPGCQRRIFAEPLTQLAVSYQRRTIRQAEALTNIALTSGGEAGSRLSTTLAMGVSGDTLLRLIRRLSLDEYPTPRVIGVDEWAFRRRVSYGTILVDLEQHRVVDLLPDRTANSLVKWLEAHPGVEIISRDRASAYADGARRGAPNAIQVADRFHLMVNLTAALERLLLHKTPSLKKAANELNAEARAKGARQLGEWQSTQDERRTAASMQRQAKYVEIYHKIQELKAKGLELVQIATEVGLSTRTVYRYLNLAEPPAASQPRRSRLDLLAAYKPYLLARWNEGYRNVNQLWLELKAQGYTQSRATVERFFSPIRQMSGVGRSFKQVGAAAVSSKLEVGQLERYKPLTAIQTAFLFSRTTEKLTERQQVYLGKLKELDQEIATDYELGQNFYQLIRSRSGQADLDKWLRAVEERGSKQLQSFAQGIKADYKAVVASVSLKWSQGSVEGQVNRLKLIKREMYGRAKFDLLRLRVISSASTKQKKQSARASKTEQKIAA